ncbi:hypothetical protein CBM2589_B10285 [Cupriavidus taiwanensis]|uniref:Uncharacterized protein n=1 Tax=Cupriavidus taiwanensis TaxID=164546 RepID=A0A375B8R5_9BURK|nr:hypothetical protein CBM2589_B10285 [Cupriavidus taiwanensis]
MLAKHSPSGSHSLLRQKKLSPVASVVMSTPLVRCIKVEGHQSGGEEI